MARTSSGGSSAAPKMPSAQELARAISRNYEARTNPAVPKRTGPTRPINITTDQLIQAASLLDTSQVVSPLAGLGGMSRSDAAAAREFSDADGSWDDYYAYDNRGYGYDNRSKKAFTESTPAGRARRMGLSQATTSPAPITVTPTTTTNPERPRTIAAGYDEDRQVLTVVFRDGTYYNYYKVPEDVWKTFQSYYSKGEYVIPNILDKYPRGIANMRGISATSREELYRINRTAQWISGGLKQYDRKAPRLDPTRQRKRK